MFKKTGPETTKYCPSCQAPVYFCKCKNMDKITFRKVKKSHLKKTGYFICINNKIFKPYMFVYNIIDLNKVYFGVYITYDDNYNSAFYDLEMSNFDTVDEAKRKLVDVFNDSLRMF